LFYFTFTYFLAYLYNGKALSLYITNYFSYIFHYPVSIIHYVTLLSNGKYGQTDEQFQAPTHQNATLKKAPNKQLAKLKLRMATSQKGFIIAMGQTACSG
jgi:hypothetical protein